jgi:hypothetical protein
MNFTFITSKKDGSVTVEQIEGINLQEALVKWNSSSEVLPELSLNEYDAPIPIVGLKNVWCTDGINREDKFFLVHIVATHD